MYALATSHTPRPDLIGFASIFAIVTVCVAAYVVRAAPARQKEGLTIMVPYLLLLTSISVSLNRRFLDIQHHVALFMLFASSFGFSLHNFTFPYRIHYVNGVISGFLSGGLITFASASYAFTSGDIQDHDLGAFRTSIAAFVAAWGFYSLFVFYKRKLFCTAQDKLSGDT